MIQRYTWQDALVFAQRDGIISNGALMVATKLGAAINWKPKNGRVPGLYWKNDDAYIHVGTGRSTANKHRAELLDAGFFTMVNGNWIPTMPESTVETTKSIVETEQSTVETTKSTGDNPLSEDIYSEDVLSEDILSEDKQDHQEKGVAQPSLAKNPQPLLDLTTNTPFLGLKTNTPLVGLNNHAAGLDDKCRQSTVGTKATHGSLTVDKLDFQNLKENAPVCQCGQTMLANFKRPTYDCVYCDERPVEHLYVVMEPSMI